MADQPPKPRRGCLFYGCLAFTVFLVAILLAALLGMYKFRKMLNEYTDTKPMPLPTVQMPPEQIAQVQRRVDAFKDAVNAGRSTEPLSLTSDEINALISSDPEYKALRGKVYATIEGDKLKAQISIPLAELGLGIFRGRYLNGSGTLSTSFQGGQLWVSAHDLVVKGKPLTGVYMDKIRNQNLAASANDDPRASVAFNRLQAIEIKDGKLILVPKQEH